MAKKRSEKTNKRKTHQWIVMGRRHHMWDTRYLIIINPKTGNDSVDKQFRRSLHVIISSNFFFALDGIARKSNNHGNTHMEKPTRDQVALKLDNFKSSPGKREMATPPEVGP